MRSDQWKNDPVWGMKPNDVKVCGVTANSAPAGGGGISGGWKKGALTINVDGVSFTPAEYEIYRLLQNIEKLLVEAEEMRQHV